CAPVPAVVPLVQSGLRCGPLRGSAPTSIDCHSRPARTERAPLRHVLPARRPHAPTGRPARTEGAPLRQVNPVRKPWGQLAVVPLVQSGLRCGVKGPWILGAYGGSSRSYRAGSVAAG